jgi:shikimate dehydrogenase
MDDGPAGRPAPVTGETTVVGVCGWPVTHSLSPVLHNAAFAAVGLDWVYVPFALRPERAVETLRAAWQLGIRGLSVTMPHKQAAHAAATVVTPDVERTGAANTLVAHDDGWTAHNTDIGGFRLFLAEDLGFAVRGRRVGIIGAGGVASAVLDALVVDGADVLVWNRTRDRAVRLGGEERVAASPAELASCDLLVGCVPPDAVPVDVGFRDGQVVVDLVYAPPRTPLMRVAADAGAEVHNGLGLLVRQAALQFELWTGRAAPLDPMRAAGRDAMRAAGRDAMRAAGRDAMRAAGRDPID